MPRRDAHTSWIPGLALSAAVAGAAVCLESLQVAIAGRAWLEPVALSILAGATVRTVWTPPERFQRGIGLAGKTLLELAIALMGATVSFAAMAAVGLPLIAAVVATVAGAIAAGFLIGRLLRLPRRLALLIACGNAICGNSAIAAVAPVIEAKAEDVAAAIAFTAALGVGVILAVPIVAHLLALSPAASGVLAGLTVYAVPQVVAAAGPMGAAAVQMGALVKLVRVLMLGPVVALLSLFGRRNGAGADNRLGPFQLVPPFILAFLALAALNATGRLPAELAGSIDTASRALTVLAMAALGLGVDLRRLRAAGPRVVLAATGSLLLLGATALAALRLLGFT